METNVQFKLIRSLGISGLVLGVITLLISFIPCLGAYAFIPGVVAICISTTGLVMARRQHIPKTILVAALIISLIGTATAIGWALYMNNVMSKDAIEEGIGTDKNDSDFSGQDDVKSLLNESAAKDSIRREAAEQDSLNALRQDQKESK